MRIVLENFNKRHIGLLKEMADILNFKFKELDGSSPEAFSSDGTISSSEEKEMTQLSMQVSQQSLAEMWDQEDDQYWNSYL